MNSSLVSYTKLSPHKSSRNGHAIDTISIHCVVGQCGVEALGSVFQTKEASANYGIGYDGRIGLYVNESERSWCTSSKANDERAITIECASDTSAPYAVNDKVYNALIDLLADVCKRNNIYPLKWSTSKDDRVNHRNGCNMTVHRDYANKSCVPVGTEVLTRNGWVKISDVEIGEEIACADLDNLKMTFEEVYDKVPVHQHDTYTNNGFTATKDHRMVYSLQKNRDFFRIATYNELLQKYGIYIPLAGYAETDGLDISDEMLSFIVAVQADGHYMYEKHKDGTKSYYGLEFHIRKERKINRVRELLEALELPYRLTQQSNGSVKIRVYNYDGVNIVNDICEKYLSGKCFTWDLLNLSREQAQLFLNEILFWDGCEAASLYTSRKHINLDVTNAVAALNGVGSRISGDNIQFRESPFMTLSAENTKRNSKQHGTALTDVTCVSVKTGVFLCRQSGKTFIIGNCPGDYLYSRHQQIADAVNKRIEDDMMVRYNSISEMPSWAKAEAQELIDIGALKGTGNSLDISEDMLRCMIICLRMSKALIATIPDASIDKDALFEEFKKNLKLTVEVE